MRKDSETQSPRNCIVCNWIRARLVCVCVRTNHSGWMARDAYTHISDYERIGPAHRSRLGNGDAASGRIIVVINRHSICRGLQKLRPSGRLPNRRAIGSTSMKVTDPRTVTKWVTQQHIYTTRFPCLRVRVRRWYRCQLCGSTIRWHCVYVRRWEADGSRCIGRRTCMCTTKTGTLVRMLYKAFQWKLGGADSCKEIPRTDHSDVHQS